MKTHFTTPLTAKTGPLVLVNGQNGITVIPTPTPLTRLNYFDGKFLRAADLTAEQRYLRSLVEYSNRAGGHGVAYGYNVTQNGENGLNIGPGLAIDPEGRVLLLPAPVVVDFQQLIDKSRQALSPQGGSKPVNASTFGDCLIAAVTPPSIVVESGDLFVITIAQAEALCGEEDVFGKLCEEACITSTDRPYRLEGVILRARPLQLVVPLPTSSAVALDQTHLRSRVASAYFETERRRVACHISKAGLESEIWCLGAQADSGSEVPIAVVARSGGGILFLDPWIVRRERIDPPAKRYWQWRMCMRPWDVFLAHILQFQCQLHACLKHRDPQGEPDDPCRDEKKLISEAADTIVEVTRFYEKVAERLVSIEAGTLLPGGLAGLRAVQAKLIDAKLLFALPPRERLLIHCGIIELPSAGYLPVVPGSAVPVNRQVRQMMGEGVDLRFCIVRPDYVAHALEEAQHMERISLVEGLDHPDAKPQVDVLVPNGEILKQESRSAGGGFEALIQFGVARNSSIAASARVAPAAIHLQGAARATSRETGGGAVYLAAVTQTEKAERLVNLVSGLAGIGKATNTHLNLLRKLSEQTDPAPLGTIAANPSLFTRLNTVSSEALRFNAARRAKAQPFLTAAAPVAAAPIFTPTQPTPDQLAAMWLAAAVEQNPFSMAVGEITPVELRFALVMPSDKPTFLDLELRGDFRMEQTVPTGGGRKITGTITCLISMTRSEAGTNPKPVHSSAKLKVTAALNAAGTLLELDLIDPESTVQFKLKSELTGDPVKARTQILYTVRRGEQTVEVEIADSLLTENAAVLETGNASHTAALSALEVVGAALNDADFADTAARLLFPPPPPPTDELLVRATLDWVLFHRRRTKTCTAVTEPIVAVKRRYQVYHLPAPDLKQAALVRDALMENNIAFLAKAGFRPVDTVEFGAGIASLLTPAMEVQTDWKAAQPGATIIYGAVATQGAALQDGSTLAVARLAKLEEVVAPISPPDNRLINETIPAVPAPLSAPGTDGSMILVTLEGPRPTCHTVFRATQDINEDFRGILTERGLSGLVERQMIFELGDARFDPGTDKIHPADAVKIRTAWENAGGGQIAASLLVFQQGDESVPANIRINQLRAIAMAATDNAGPAPQQPAELEQPLGIDCTSATILQAAPADIARSARLIYALVDGGFILPENPKERRLEFRNNEPQGDSLRDFIRSLTPNEPVGRLFLTTRDAVDPGAGQRLDAVAAALEGEGKAKVPQDQRTKRQMNEEERERLANAGFDPEEFDEVIWFVR